jgi:hypothetical protein
VEMMVEYDLNLARQERILHDAGHGAGLRSLKS